MDKRWSWAPAVPSPCSPNSMDLVVVIRKVCGSDAMTSALLWRWVLPLSVLLLLATEDMCRSRTSRERRRGSSVAATSGTGIASNRGRRNAASLRQFVNEDMTDNTESTMPSGPGGKPPRRNFQRHTLFVGQLPYNKNKNSIRSFFLRHSGTNITAEDVNVRLLTDNKTGRSRGIAFVDFRTREQMIRGLRLHHYNFSGRVINIERTVGGGGNNPRRKEKLDHLRNSQFTAARKLIQNILQHRTEAIAKSAAKLNTTANIQYRSSLTLDEIDNRTIDILCTFPRRTVKEVLGSVAKANLSHIKNKNAYLMTILARVRREAVFGLEGDPNLARSNDRNDTTNFKQSLKVDTNGSETRNVKPFELFITGSKTRKFVISKTKDEKVGFERAKNSKKRGQSKKKKLPRKKKRRESMEERRERQKHGMSALQLQQKLRNVQ